MLGPGVDPHHAGPPALPRKTRITFSTKSMSLSRRERPSDSLTPERFGTTIKARLRIPVGERRESVLSRA